MDVSCGGVRSVMRQAGLVAADQRRLGRHDCAGRDARGGLSRSRSSLRAVGDPLLGVCGGAIKKRRGPGRP